MSDKHRNFDITVFLKTLGGIGVFFLILPVLVVIPMSFVGDRYLKFPPTEWSISWYANIINSSQWHGPLLRSIVIAFAVACISLLLGILGAYSLRNISWNGKSLIIFLFLLPLVVPPVIIGVGLLLLYAKVSMADTIPGVVFSHMLLSMPYSILIFSVGMSRANMKLEDVACSLGANRLFAFFKVTLPQLKNSLFAAWILSFLVSFDEPVIALFVTSSNARTLPRQMLDGIRYDLDPTAAAISSVLIMVSILISILKLKKSVVSK